MFFNKKTFTPFAMLLILPLTGCDYSEKLKSIDRLKQQQAEQISRIDRLEKQQAVIADNTRALARIATELKRQQESFAFTEFNPAQTKYFILNNGSLALAGRVLSISPTDNGSVIHMSLVNLLSVPVSSVGYQVTWGGEKPATVQALAKWRQLLFSTEMDSPMELLPGQWRDINLTLKGVSPNNLKYLKMAINMENLKFDRQQPAENQQKKSKK